MGTSKKSIDTARETGNQSRYYRGRTSWRKHRIRPTALPSLSRAGAAAAGAEAASLPSPPPVGRRSILVPARSQVRGGGRVALVDSMPSAITFNFNLCASRIISSTVSPVSRSASIPFTRERSIFNASTGNCRSPLKDEFPVPKSSRITPTRRCLRCERTVAVNFGVGCRHGLRHLQVQARGVNPRLPQGRFHVGDEPAYRPTAGRKRSR